MKKDFYVHVGLLLHYSSYFRKALNPVWVEGHTKSITLSEDSPAIFHMFFHWIYTGEIYSTLTNGRIPISFKDILALYVFADARGIPELCNAAVDVFFQKFANEWVFPSPSLAYVYENTLAGSNLRAIVVHLAVCCFNFCNLKQTEQNFPKEFLVDVVLCSVQLKIAPGNVPDKQAFLDKRATEMCTYHDHKCPHDLDKTRSS
jgi:hypothetical protein